MFTTEQKNVIDACQNSKSNFIKIEAVAGSGKTHVLKGIAKKFPDSCILYTAFNAAVIEEGRLTFPKNVECRTLHALAYKYIVPIYKYKITKKFDIEQIKKEDFTPSEKRAVIRVMDAFFYSNSLSLSSIDEMAEPYIVEVAKEYIQLMEENKIQVTFNFLIKFFYLQLAEGNIDVEYDIIMLDEAGDLSEVTVEIFKLIRAKQKKIMVGDRRQNIYGFMNTVNGFAVLKDEGESLTLTQSFRVETEIAKGVENFCQSFIDKNMVFTGTDIPDKTIRTRAYIARTNAALVDRMMKLHKERIPYSTLRNVKEIFALPLGLITAICNKPVTSEAASFLNVDRIKYFQSAELRQQHNTFVKYLKSLHQDDLNLMTAIRLLEKHKHFSVIYDCYTDAMNQPKTRQTTILATAHVSKGQTYDSVFIEEDLNKAVASVIGRGGPETEDDMAELNLYYVATTRGRLELMNATYATMPKKEEI